MVVVVVVGDAVFKSDVIVVFSASSTQCVRYQPFPLNDEQKTLNLRVFALLRYLFTFTTPLGKPTIVHHFV